MLLKKKIVTPSRDPRQRAGDEAEKQMAFYLDRQFEDKDKVFLLHDLRIEHGNHAFQIDHLVVTRYGIALVESKSIHTKVSITRHDQRREHWSREFNGKEEGMASPVRQVQEQARLLQEFLIENKAHILGKVLFALQKGYKYCPFDTYVGVSTSAIFQLAEGTPLPEHVYKADEVAPEIAHRLKEREKSDTLLSLNPLASPPWEISLEEARKTAEFLLAHHVPLASKAPQIEAAASQTTSQPPQTAPVRPLTDKTTTPSQPQQAGDICPQCGTRKVAVASGGPVKADGSRDKYLACLGHQDNTCAWAIPFPIQATPQPSSPLTPPPTTAPLELKSDEPADTSSGDKEYYCFACRAAIPKVVAAFCWDRRTRFGGKAYCRSCQTKFTEKPSKR